MTMPERDMNAWFAVAHEVALAEAEQLRTTPEIRRRAEALAGFAQDQLAAMRRAERERQPARIVSGAIRPSIQQMGRDQLLTRLRAIRSLHPEMQIAYREYVGETDDDLRSALEDAESLLVP